MYIRAERVSLKIDIYNVHVCDRAGKIMFVHVYINIDAISYLQQYIIQEIFHHGIVLKCKWYEIRVFITENGGGGGLKVILTPLLFYDYEYASLCTHAYFLEFLNWPI